MCLRSPYLEFYCGGSHLFSFDHCCPSQKIAGADTTMQLTFTTALGSAPYTVEKVKAAIGTLNDKRKERLRLLLDYIEDQGEHFCLKHGRFTLEH